MFLTMAVKNDVMAEGSDEGGDKGRADGLRDLTEAGWKLRTMSGSQERKVNMMKMLMKMSMMMLLLLCC